MKDRPTDEQIAKLPKWAQQHIVDLRREAHSARSMLAEYLDSQHKSGVWTENYVNGVFEKQYIQDYVVHFQGNGVFLHVHIAQPNDSQRRGIELSWGPTALRNGDIAFIPASYQQAYLLSREDMR